MMKTLLVVPWDQDRGGVASVVGNLARYLQDRGHEVLFFHPGKSFLLKSRLTKHGFSGVQLRLNMPFGSPPHRVLRTLAFPFLFTISILQLIWFILSRRIQIVNLHYPEDYFAYFAICRYLLPIRLVTSVHGGDAFLNGRPKDKYSRAFRLLFHSSDLIILPSNAYRERLLEVFPGIQGKTIFIHNGVSPTQFSPTGNVQDTNDKKRYLLCLGDHSRYKGIDVLLHASKSLLTSDQSLRLVLAGDGPLREELERLALSLGIRQQTEFLGTKGVAEIAKLLRGCEILVVPSREESFCIAVIEAMACKKPVVASAVGGIPEIIEHAKTGILVEPENPEALAEGLRRVLGNSELRKTLAGNAYSRVMERFCFTHTGGAYERAFTSLLVLRGISPRNA